MPAYLHFSRLICAVLNLVPWQIVSYLLDLPEKDEEEVERAQINNFDTLWGETGGVCLPAATRHFTDRTPTDRWLWMFSGSCCDIPEQ